MLSKIPRDLSREIWTLHETIGTHQFDGFVPLSWEEWTYFRESPNQTGLKPSFALAYFHNKLIGIASLTRQWMYASKFGIHLPLAFQREFVVDHSIGVSDEMLNEIYFGLVYTLIQAAHQRNCSMMLINQPPGHKHQQRAMQLGGVINTRMGGTYMIKPMKKELQLPSKTKKPLYISPGESFMSP
jgi:hypothetical protein